jgi:hypothetical protein
MADCVFVRDGCRCQTAASRSNSDQVAESSSIFLAHSASNNQRGSSFARPKLGVAFMSHASVTSSSLQQRAILARQLAGFLQ